MGISIRRFPILCTILFMTYIYFTPNNFYLEHHFALTFHNSLWNSLCEIHFKKTIYLFKIKTLLCH